MVRMGLLGEGYSILTHLLQVYMISEFHNLFCYGYSVCAKNGKVTLSLLVAFVLSS